MLMRKASSRFELVSLRACGFSLFQIQRPILIAALGFSCLNFWLVSDVATFCHQKARVIERNFREVNPLVFLKKPELLGVKGLQVLTLGEVDPGKSAYQSVIALQDLKKGRLTLLMADSLTREGLDVIGHNVFFLTSSNESHQIPDILIDQAKEMRVDGESFVSAFKKEGGKISVDFLPTPLLVHKIIENSANLKLISEALRRLSMTLEPLTLALIGLSFGIHVGRQNGCWSHIQMGVLVCLSLLLLFLGKSFDKSLAATICIYLVPHPLLWFFSFMRLRKIACGSL
jgi:lipopolysaccharide export LptBFGC system permease protein LptF